MAEKRYVFLSYGRKDVYPQGTTNAVEQEQHFSIVEKVYRHLYGLRESTKLEPWFDKLCLTKDRAFTDSINQAIERSDYMLLFIGKHSMGSEWCEREWKHALANCVPVIPVLLEGGWGDKDIQDAYPEHIRSTDGINPQKTDGTWDEDYLLKQVASALEKPISPLAISYNAKSLPEHYIERLQYINELKKRLSINDRDYAQRKSIVAITSQQEIEALQGIGGIGKTTLALAFCNDCEVRRAFDQIFWLELGPKVTVADAPGLMRIIGTHFEDSPDLYTDLQTSRALVQKHLSGKRTLLILDDVWTENLTDAFSWSGIDCRILVTTRNKGLIENPEAVNKLSVDEGLRLLATFFDPLNPDTSKLNDEHRAIVTMLDGYTLAIAIAGKWMNKYGQGRAAEYLKRLRSGEGDLFKNLELSKTDKNANLELSLSLSYNDLDVDNQKRFRALGVFAAGSSYPLAALDALWDTTDGFIEAGVLVDAGLLEIIKGTSGDDRYSQHSLLRAYARALLDKAEEATDCFIRYADFYTELANQFYRLPPEQWGILEDELSNITVVGDELVKQTDKGQKGDLERARVFAYNTSRYLTSRRQVRRIEWSEMGLNAAHALQENADDKTYYLKRESYFLNDLALVYNDLGEKRKALDFYERALPIDQELEDKSGEATTLNNIGLVWSDLGEKRKALDFYERALPILRAVDNRRVEATTLNNIGMVWDGSGEPRKALEYYNQALPLLRAVGDKSGEATTLNNIGRAWRKLGEKDKALNFYEQALPILRAVGNRSIEATTLNNMAYIYYFDGDVQKALDYFKQVVTIFKDVGNAASEAALHDNIAQVYKKLGDIDSALSEQREAIRILKHYSLPYDAGDGSVQEYEARIQQWEHERDGLPTVEDEQAQAWAAIVKIYREQGEDGLRVAAKQAGLDDAQIEQVVAQVKGMDKPE